MHDGNIEAIEALIATDADANAKDYEGMTAIAHITEKTKNRKYCRHSPRCRRLEPVKPPVVERAFQF